MLTCLECQLFWVLNLLFYFWYFLAYFLSIFDPKFLSKINEKMLIIGHNGKMSPREPSGSSKKQKAAFSKTLKKPTVFDGFWVQRHPKRASRNPKISQEEPKENQNHQQKDQKLNPKN